MRTAGDPRTYQHGYAGVDLTELDHLIDEYCAIAFADVDRRNLKRAELLHTRRRMALACVTRELAVRTLLNDVREGSA